MKTSPIFEVFFRTGFDNSCLTNSISLLDPINQVARVNQYKLDTPFTDLLQQIKNVETPFVLFIDDAVQISKKHLEEMNDFLHTNKKIIGLTFKSKAIKTIYGYENKKNLLSWLKKKPSNIQGLPSWFSLLNKDFLKKNGLLDTKCQTLEFFLFELSEILLNTNNTFLLLESLNINFDSTLWIRDIILNNAASLASDFSHFDSLHKHGKIKSEIPYQFRVELSGVYVSLSQDKQDLSNKKQTQKPMFSVICPAYKSTFFKEMIDSISSQTWQDWELVVIIDGPPKHEEDKLLSIIKNTASDSRIRFECQDNKGTGPTRSRLARMAKGDFVITIDDDDKFFPDTLEVFARAISSCPDVSVFRGGAQLFGLVDLYLKPRQRIIINDISNDLFEVTQPFAIKRDTLEKLGGFEGDKNFKEAGEDSDLFHKIDKAKLKTSLIDKPLYFRRLSMFNQTLTLKPKECLEHILSLINKHRPPDWNFLNIDFKRKDVFIKSTISYQHNESNLEIVTATKFFDYQTLGESSKFLIDLEITSVCNSVCVFCPRDEMKRENKYISMELVNILAEQISLEKNRRQIILCGIGESTLHPELETIVETLSNAGAKVRMTTNGSLMNVDKFKQLADAGMVGFNFSLNATTAETHRQVMKMHNFDNIRRDISAILEHKKKIYPDVEINLSFVLCKQNQHEVFDFVEEWRNTGVSKVWIHPVNNRAGALSKDAINVDISSFAGKFADDDMVIVDVFKHISEHGDVCKIAQSVDFISVDGDMLLCALDYKRGVLIGNLKDTPLQEMHTKKILKYKQGEINKICHKCDFPSEVSY